MLFNWGAAELCVELLVLDLKCLYDTRVLSLVCLVSDRLGKVVYFAILRVLYKNWQYFFLLSSAGSGSEADLKQPGLSFDFRSQAVFAALPVNRRGRAFLDIWSRRKSLETFVRLIRHRL